ncbi:heterogeneous nuclear ribonucleoprotein F-like [Bolinopsis microptera]|uniref:heterogeneous nuclear ribonucleoprotein F-like n=1 Tax=Bolinopsis microptera TaxID=2820187 RepID=UPI003079B444
MESHVDWVLRCRGLPYSITKVEMEKFFDTSTLATNTEDCVQITYNEEGRPSGECFVVMSNEESYYNGLRKNNEYLKSRYIEVFESDWDDMNRALQKGAVNRQYYGGTEAPIVKLRGLPFSVTDEQITEFFSGLQVISMKVKRKEDGDATGEGYVKFGKQSEATTALEKHMQKIGHRYIEVFKGSKREMREEIPLDSKKPKKLGYGGELAYMGGPKDHKVFMRGIPFKASQGDVIKFFAPLMPRHIEIIIGDDGRPSGTAFAFFHSHEDALLAMEKDKETMDTRYVDLFLESSAENGTVEDPVTQAQKLIAQAHGLQPPAPQNESAHDVTLTAQHLIAQARGVPPPAEFPSAGQPPYPGAQPPAPYPGAQPPQQHYPSASHGSDPPVRKRLMAGAVRPIASYDYKLAEDEYSNKRHKRDNERGGGRFKRGFQGNGGIPARGGSQSGGRGIPARSRGSRGGPPRGGFPSRSTGFSRKPMSLMVSATDPSPDTATNGDNTDVYNSGYPALPAANTAYQDPNSVYQDPSSAYQDPNYGYQNPYPGYQGPTSSYTDSYAGYPGYPTASTGYSAQSYPNPAAISATDYSSYLPGSGNGMQGMQQYSYQS